MVNILDFVAGSEFKATVKLVNILYFGSGSGSEVTVTLVTTFTLLQEVHSR